MSSEHHRDLPTIIELSRYLVRLPDQQVDDNLTVTSVGYAEPMNLNNLNVKTGGG